MITIFALGISQRELTNGCRGLIDRVVFKDKHGFEQGRTAHADQLLNFAQSNMTMAVLIRHGDLLCLYPVHQHLTGSQTGIHRQGVDEQTNATVNPGQWACTTVSHAANDDFIQFASARKNQRKQALKHRGLRQTILSGELLESVCRLVIQGDFDVFHPHAVFDGCGQV